MTPATTCAQRRRSCNRLLISGGIVLSSIVDVWDSLRRIIGALRRDMAEFDDRVAVVTGASSGIGKRTAEILAERGARVVIFARSAEKLSAIASRHGDRMLAVAGDASDPESVERLFRETETRFGDCDIVINNAGMIDPDPVIKTSVERWDRMF